MELNATSQSEVSANTPVSSAETKTAAAVPMKPIEISPPQMVSVRRRSRRKRRSRADRSETPQRRAYIVLLCVILALMAIAAVKGVRQSVYNWLHSISPALARAGIGLETVALVLAGLILLYLMPGMEERILRWLGIRRNKR